jgi:putative transposase
MVLGLERRQVEGDVHFVTFSCYHRHPNLESPLLRDLFEDALQKVHWKYQFDVLGYVVMPEHVHMLLSEPSKDLLSVGLQALKISVSKRAKEPLSGRRATMTSMYSLRKNVSRS